MLEYLEEDETYRAVQDLFLQKTGVAPDLYAGQPRQRDEIQAKEVELAAVMWAGIAAGEFRADLDPVDGTRAMSAYLDGFTPHWLLAPEAYSIAASAPTLVDIYLCGIVAHSFSAQANGDYLEP
jgi:TetR/AcrR family acrAB operon transcriptional repressor